MVLFGVRHKYWSLELINQLGSNRTTYTNELANGSEPLATWTGQHNSRRHTVTPTWSNLCLVVEMLLKTNCVTIATYIREKTYQLLCFATLSVHRQKWFVLIIYCVKYRTAIRILCFVHRIVARVS